MSTTLRNAGSVSPAIAAIEKMRRTKQPRAIPTYNSVKRMIKQAAYKYSQSYKLPLDDMEAQADYLYVKACKLYVNSRNAKFSTFLHIVLRTGLINYAREQFRPDIVNRELPYTDDEGKEVDPLEQIKDEKAHRKYAMIDFYESLTADERELVELVLYGLASTLDTLKKLVMQRLGYDAVRFDEAVQGIRELLKEAA